LTIPYGYKTKCNCYTRVWGLGKTKKEARDWLFHYLNEQKGKTMKKIVTICVLTLLFSTGCGTTLTNISNWMKTNETDLKTAVHAGTLIVVTKYPTRKVMITKIMQDVKAAIAVGTLTNAQMVADYIKKQINVNNLDAGQLIVMNDLLVTVQDKIVSAFKLMKITNAEDQLIEVGKVLDWVLDITIL
jgi:hypothetical protein